MNIKQKGILFFFIFFVKGPQLDFTDTVAQQALSRLYENICH